MLEHSYPEFRDAVLNDRGVHFFTQNIIRESETKDPTDAVNDIKLALRVAQARLDHITAIYRA